MPPNFQSGATLDTRPAEKKLKDYKFKEIVAAANPVNWVEKSESEWRKFPEQNQDGSGSCVEQTVRKLAGIQAFLKEKQYVEFSAGFYQLRSNKPQSGMIGVEAFDIWMNSGIPLEVLVESDNMNDAQMDDIQIEQYEKDIAKVFAISGHVGIDNGDFETVASVIQTTGKGVMVWFYFTSSEWSQLIPTIKSPNLTVETGARHSVTAIDPILYNGKKYILVEDSAHFGGFTRHLISEEFFKARNWFTRYPMNFKFDTQEAPVTPKPKYTFTTPFEFGQTKADVKVWQDILKYEGFYPLNTASTGYYGAITTNGTLKWQTKHQVASSEELTLLAGRKVGSKTIAAANLIYS